MLLIPILLVAVVTLLATVFDQPGVRISTNHDAICSNLRQLLDDVRGSLHDGLEYANDETITEIFRRSPPLGDGVVPRLQDLKRHLTVAEAAPDLEHGGQPIECPVCAEEHRGPNNVLATAVYQWLGRSRTCVFISPGHLEDPGASLNDYELILALLESSSAVSE